uniref:Uncharacterized protein n=1 Tax=Rhizophagus irregularis (strain DAOM 181602 / DAOM 197198 / MUCL 43194) TaxID=747089 RepID=U9T581_RHIID
MKRLLWSYANLEDNDENVIVSTDEDINRKLEEAFKLYNLKLIKLSLRQNFIFVVFAIIITIGTLKAPFISIIQTFEKDNSFE